MFKINLKALELLMQTHNVTPSKLSRSSGLSKSAISRILNGHTDNPSPDTIRAICDYFGVSVASIMGVVDGAIEDSSIWPTNALRENLKNLMIRSSVIGALDLHHKSGISVQSIERILCGSTTNPHTKTLLDLANYFGVTISQLKGLDPLPYEIENFDVGEIRAPIIELQCAGKFLSDAMSSNEPTGFVNISNRLVNGRMFATRIGSNKYFPYFKAGNLLIVDSGLTSSNGDYIIASLKKGIPDIFEYIQEELIYVRAAEGDECHEISEDEIDIYGVVVEIKLKP